MWRDGCNWGAASRKEGVFWGGFPWLAARIDDLLAYKRTKNGKKLQKIAKKCKKCADFARNWSKNEKN